MLVLRLPLRLAARATPSHAPVATPIVASSFSATRSYRTKANDSTTPKKKAAPKKLSKEEAAKAAYKLLSPEEKTLMSVKAREAAKEAKKKEELKLLKAQALTPPKYRQVNAWSIYIKENSKSTPGSVGESAKILAQQFKNVSSIEREHLNHLVNEHNAKSLREFQEWLSSHTPAQILEANAARARLRRLLVDSKSKYAAIKDDRLVKRPLSSYLQYHNERLASGDFRGISTPVACKDIGREYKALTASERKVCHGCSTHLSHVTDISL